MKLYPSLTDDLADWAQRQPVFFTGSAATHGRHINVSPKGFADSHFAVLSPNQCAYIDRTGSGCETIAHAYENGRLCLMFMSFGHAPRIMRLFCTSRIVEWDHPTFQELAARVSGGNRPVPDGARAVIVADIWEVQTSCGYGVPRVRKALYSSQEEEEEEEDEGTQPSEGGAAELSVFEARPTLDKWAATQVEKGSMFAYQQKNNVQSIDGLPGLRAARRDTGQRMWLEDIRAWLTRVLAEKDAMAVGFIAAVVLYVLLARFGLL